MNNQYTDKIIDGFLVQDAVEQRFYTTIYRAVQVSIKRFVSFKVLPLPADEAQRDLFLREFNQQVTQIASLEHVHLLPIYASGRIGNEAVYIASRLLPGTLDGLLRVGALPMDAALSIARQLGETLAYLHARSFVHRSISPKVVYITSENATYINDLELSQVIQKAVSLPFLQELLGTLNYLPPELFRSEALDFRADVYGFGATLYDLVTGEPPFRTSTTTDALCEAKESNALRPPRTFNQAVSPELDAIIMRALRADPVERFPSAREMLDALYALDPNERLWKEMRTAEKHVERVSDVVRRFFFRQRE